MRIGLLFAAFNVAVKLVPSLQLISTASSVIFIFACSNHFAPELFLLATSIFLIAFSSERPGAAEKFPANLPLLKATSESLTFFESAVVVGISAVADFEICMGDFTNPFAIN